MALRTCSKVAAFDGVFSRAESCASAVGVNLICRCRLFLRVLCKRAAINALPFGGLPQAFLHAGQSLRVLVKPHFRSRNRLYRIKNELAESVAVDVVGRGAIESFS